MNKPTIPTQGFAGAASGNSRAQAQLINFLQSELAIPATSIAFALKQVQYEPNQLPMILWQYGLLTLVELEQVFDWLETTPA